MWYVSVLLTVVGILYFYISLGDIRAIWSQGLSLSRLWGRLVGCFQNRELGARASRLLRFILLVSFNDTLLVVSILDIVYDCHL